ncbi:MAG: folate-binding protein [Parasulfuritortus sp.]|nr:folate-binding protein [Parasulfuritortus sp.]
MTTHWTDFLQSCGARFSDGRISDFGDLPGELMAARNDLVLADLSHWGLIGFSGEEAQTFLHGQITNDLRGLVPDRAVFAAYCSAKGRMLANLLVFKRGDDVLVMLPETVRETVQKRLTMFILRAKVKARNAGEEWVRLGLSGPGAEALLAATSGLLPAAGIMAVAQADSAFAVRLGSERFDIFVSPEKAPSLWEKLADKARPVSSGAWDWLMVDGGIPSVVPETQDQFVPQMANMADLHGISFTKGCYPGQEIVARTQYLGKQKRRMYLAHVETEAKAGEPVFSPEFGVQSAGMVANAAPAPGGGSDLLVVMQISSFEGGNVRLASPDGAQLAFRPLPYPVAESAA